MLLLVYFYIYTIAWFPPITCANHMLMVYRVGLFTPDMAFEVIVRNQIKKLTDPSIKCVDMVMTELMELIKMTAEMVCY